LLIDEKRARPVSLLSNSLSQFQNKRAVSLGLFCFARQRKFAEDQERDANRCHNWAYQPLYVSSNTPWFFNGVRILGLVIAKAVVEAHGGTIRIPGQLGEGSVFSFTLPLKSVNVQS
jgi:hypothetical protein